MKERKKKGKKERWFFQWRSNELWLIAKNEGPHFVGYQRQLIQHRHCNPVYFAVFRYICKIMTWNSVGFRNLQRMKRVRYLLQLCTLLIIRKNLRCLLTVMVNSNPLRQVALGLYIFFALMRCLRREDWCTRLIKIKTSLILFLCFSFLSLSIPNSQHPINKTHTVIP
jgi:hypothetical protein